MNRFAQQIETAAAARAWCTRFRIARSRRDGLSLLEVLISIAIVTVAMFGLLALLPIAGRQAERGLINDRKAAAGKNAVSEFFTRGMHQPGNWVYNGAPFIPGPANPNYPAAVGYGAFCIDPQMAAIFPTASVFPVTPGTYPAVNAMPRISLRGWGGGPMTIPMADFVFTAHDDLAFAENPDLTLPPLQQYALAGTNPTVREIEAGYSWMATVAPRFTPGNSVIPQDNMYILSIVVFHNRNLNTNPAVPPVAGTTEKPTPERLAMVNKFWSAGYGGGDVSITFQPNGSQNFTPPPGKAVNDSDLDVKKNDWVMLAPNANSIPYFRWYRVVDADFELDTTTVPGTPLRHITLDGPDWPYFNVPGPLQPAFRFPQMIIPTGVVAVYERMVRLEYPIGKPDGASVWAD